MILSRKREISQCSVPNVCFCVFEGLNFERFTARGFDLFSDCSRTGSLRAGFRAIQNTPKTPARSGSGLCLFSLFRRDRLRQLRKNTDMHPLVGNNLIEKLDSYCGRLCQLSGLFFGYARSTADRRQSYLFRPGY